MKRISERWWLAGAFVTTLAGASIASVTPQGPRLESTARAAPRHRTPAPSRPAVEDALSSAPEPAPPPDVRAPAPRPARATPPDDDQVTLYVPDLPEPPPHSPLEWDDLFPARPGAARGGEALDQAPCFDKLQGIAGLSPCPAATPR